MDLVISSATHRAGSTLLQRICNIRKENLIWGEHGGVLNDFVKMKEEITHYSNYSEVERVNYFNNNENPNKWIANMTPSVEYVDEAINSSVKNLFNELYMQYGDNRNIIGFKEVRYGKKELEILRNCYPDCKILLLVREPVSTWGSAPDWYESIDHFTNKWNKHTLDYIEFDKNDKNSFLIRYEDLVKQDEEILNKIATIANCSINEIKNVLNYKIRSTAKPVNNKDAEIIREQCKYQMEKLNYI